MERKVLSAKFFNRSASAVAKDLLGKFLVRKYRGRELAHMIAEVEIYDGLKDKGSHAWRGRTKRNFPMFGPAGIWYVYFTYGMHYMLNIVTGPENYPAAILIRGIDGIFGPARLTKKLKIDKNFNNKPANKKSGLWIEDRGVKIGRGQICAGPRIGIDYAGEFWKRKEWRFWLYGLPENVK